MFKNKVQRNSQQEIVDYLKTTRFMSENEIQKDVWGYYRGGWESNKKYADLLRRGVAKGLIIRTEQKKNGSRFVYNVAPPVVVSQVFVSPNIKEVQLNQASYRVEEYVDRNSGNVCELFQVVVDGVLIYERDYGSVGSGIREYVDDYLDFIS